MTNISITDDPHAWFLIRDSLLICFLILLFFKKLNMQSYQTYQEVEHPHTDSKTLASSLINEKKHKSSRRGTRE